MTRDEFFELDAAAAAAELNSGIEAGQSKDEVPGCSRHHPG